LTLGEVEKIAPSAIWRLDISSHSTRSGFSHSLGQATPVVGDQGQRCAVVPSLESAPTAMDRMAPLVVAPSAVKDGQLGTFGGDANRPRAQSSVGGDAATCEDVPWWTSIRRRGDR